MLEVLTQTLRLGCDTAGAGLVRSGGWPLGRERLLDTRVLPLAPTDAPQRWSELLRAVVDASPARGLTLRVVLADALVRLFMVTPPRNAARLQDCRAAAAMRFRTLYDGAAGDWQLEADWDARHPFLVCAMPRALRAALLQAAAQSRLRLITVAPQFIVALNRWRHSSTSGSSGAWFGVVHAGQLTLGIAERGRLQTVRTLRPAHLADLDAPGLAALLAQEALRLGQPAPPRLQLCGTVPSAWLVPAGGALQCQQLDAMGSAVLASTPPLALAATGLRA